MPALRYAALLHITSPAALLGYRATLAVALHGDLVLIVAAALSALRPPQRPSTCSSSSTGTGARRSSRCRSPRAVRAGLRRRARLAATAAAASQLRQPRWGGARLRRFVPARPGRAAARAPVEAAHVEMAVEQLGWQREAGGGGCNVGNASRLRSGTGATQGRTDVATAAASGGGVGGGGAASAASMAAPAARVPWPHVLANAVGQFDGVPGLSAVSSCPSAPPPFLAAPFGDRRSTTFNVAWHRYCRWEGVCPGE